jgi:hypothetical protein
MAAAWRCRERGRRFPTPRRALSLGRGHSSMRRAERLPAAHGQRQSQSPAGMALGERSSLAKTASIPVSGPRALISSRMRASSISSRKRFKPWSAAAGTWEANRARGLSARRSEVAATTDCEDHTAPSQRLRCQTIDNGAFALVRDSRSSSYGFACAVRPPLLEDDPLDDDPDEALPPPPDPPLPESRDDPDEPAYDPELPLSRV